MLALPMSPSFSCPIELCGGLLGGTAKHAASNAAQSVLDGFAAWIVSGAAWLVSHTFHAITGATHPDITTPVFAYREAIMIRIALLLVLPLVLVATVGAVLHQDGRRLVRIYGVGIPVACIASVAVVSLCEGAVHVVDLLCDAITSKATYAPYSHLDGNLSGHGTPFVVELIVGSVVVVAALFLWMELVLRAVVIDIAVFFFPLALAAIVWPATTHIAKRFLEVLVAIIGSKFVIVATLTLGASMAEQTKAGIDDALKATAILLFASFTPFALLRLVPVIEIAAAAQLEGLSRRPVRAAAGVASTAVSAGTSAAGFLLGGSGGDGVGSKAVSGTEIPTRSGDYMVGGGESPAGSSPASSPSSSSPSSSSPASSEGGPGGGGGGSDPPTPAPWSLLGGSSGGGSGGGGSGGGGSGGGEPGGGEPGGGSQSGGSQSGGSQSGGGSGGDWTAPAWSSASPSPPEPSGPDPADLAGPLPVLERSQPGPSPAFDAGASDD
jgi:hypothetical protein